jgi:hypothetical protein
MIIAPASGTDRRTSVSRRSAAVSTDGIHSPLGSSAVRQACAVMSLVRSSPRRALNSSPDRVRHRIWPLYDRKMTGLTTWSRSASP